MLKFIPESICNLKKLRFVNLNGNKFHEVPDVFTKLENLKCSDGMVLHNYPSLADLALEDDEVD